MTERVREFSGTTFIRALIPFRRAPPSWPHHLPKAPLPNNTTWGLGYNTWIWEGHIQPVTEGGLVGFHFEGISVTFRPRAYRGIPRQTPLSEEAPWTEPGMLEIEGVPLGDKVEPGGQTPGVRKSLETWGPLGTGVHSWRTGETPQRGGCREKMTNSTCPVTLSPRLCPACFFAKMSIPHQLSPRRTQKGWSSLGGTLCSPSYLLVALTLGCM